MNHFLISIGLIVIGACLMFGIIGQAPVLLRNILFPAGAIFAALGIAGIIIFFPSKRG